MTLLNHVIVGRRIQILLPNSPISSDYSLKEWYQEVFKRRSRGLWPRSGPWPIFYYWVLGPIDIRIWTNKATKKL